ncbi:hypothetical protein [Candidatus Nitrospira bockiana]
MTRDNRHLTDDEIQELLIPRTTESPAPVPRHDLLLKLLASGLGLALFIFAMLSDLRIL